MPDAYGNITPEERMKLLAAQMRAQAAPAPQMSPNPGMTPGMQVGAGNISPEMMAAAVRDTAPQREDLTGQMAMAQEMMRPGDVKGVQAGNVYVGPTWSAALADAVRQGTGGYLAYKTGQKRGELNREQAAIDEAKGQVAVGEYADTRGDEAARQQAVLLEGQQRGQGLTLEAARDAADAKYKAASLAEQIRAARVSESAAAAAAQLAATKGDVTTYHNPEDPALAFNVVTSPAGISYGLTPTGERGAPVDITQLTPWAPSTEGSSAAAREAAAARLVDPRQPEGGVASPNNMMQVLDSPVLEEATGVGPERWAGQLGLGPQGEDVQITQNQIKRNIVGSLIPDLKAAKLAPVTDKDIAKLEEQYATLQTQPRGHVEFAVNHYRPLFDKKFNEAIANGVVTQEDRDAYMQRLDTSIARAAVQYGYPVSQLAVQGLDPEVLEWAALQEKKKRAGAN